MSTACPVTLAARATTPPFWACSGKAHPSAQTIAKSERVRHPARTSYSSRDFFFPFHISFGVARALQMIPRNQPLNGAPVKIKDGGGAAAVPTGLF